MRVQIPPLQKLVCPSEIFSEYAFVTESRQSLKPNEDRKLMALAVSLIAGVIQKENSRKLNLLLKSGNGFMAVRQYRVLKPCLQVHDKRQSNSKPLLSVGEFILKQYSDVSEMVKLQDFDSCIMWVRPLPSEYKRLSGL